MKKAVFITVGCKVCQYESDVLKEAFEKLGYQTSTSLESADIYIINTCAVTNEAERKSRQMVSKCNKLNPKAKIFICGCASQNNPQQFQFLENVKYVTGTVNKLSILDHLNKKGVKIFDFCNYYEDMDLSTSSNTRAYVKIQDGCNNFCSYCLIPYLRGRSRSRDILSIIKEVERLKKNNVQEVVLTGIDVSDYKIDNEPALIQLLKQLDGYGINIRLSSMEPNLLTNEFISELTKLKNFCPHFHISMQSGSDTVLKRMNRKYNKAFYIKKVLKLKKAFPNCAITTDVIVGFPGETEKEFQQTIKTVKKCGFAYIHIFPYSRRSGTACDKILEMNNNPDFYLVNGGLVKQRAKVLGLVNRDFHEKFNKNQIGLTLNVLFEEKKSGFWIGHSKNYVKVYVESKENLANTKANVLIKETYQDGVLGEII